MPTAVSLFEQQCRRPLWSQAHIHAKGRSLPELWLSGNAVMKANRLGSCAARLVCEGDTEAVTYKQK